MRQRLVVDTSNQILSGKNSHFGACRNGGRTDVRQKNNIIQGEKRIVCQKRFPPLYEVLLLSYRWAEVDLGLYRLLANEPSEDLLPLLSAMRADVHWLATLMPNGYIPFGKGPDVDYNPVCFDFRQRHKNGDCRIVRLDHEAILCDGRIGAITELAPNFRSLVLNTIERSAAKQKPSV